ncbi:transporter [Reichenbachiella ulvae]|uniref:Transporter n=1 Tax=Reichenbachiella ulvae TaxID=2980104 RepID=A0ABT3CQT2_9BACT|nr:transporter [Reichenbachiella ulvae]MCV9385839.1 transporter [Reichenbachiella ulvae]
MKRLYFSTIVFCLFGINQIYAQGCVAIRGFSGCASGMGNTFGVSEGEFFTSAGFRYFKSFRHFRGAEEEHERIEQGTEVINHSYFLDLSINYGITDRLYATAILPMLYHDRSSMYEHGGNPPNGLGERHHTSSYGLGDIRLGAGYWLLDPNQSNKHNLAFGLGVKLPTGKYDYKDTFYNQ